MDTGPTVQQLFKQWRTDRDADAGQQMAQKFSDWYYAITAARLGDRVGREPLERACQSFAEGIVQVSRTSDLVDWAHALVVREMAAAGGRVPGGDFPNALTARRSPTELLGAARQALPAHQVQLLGMAFDPSVDMGRLEVAADAHGGVPHAILEARYALKRFLRDAAQVPLQVVPDRPDLDLAPLPLYEAARMRSSDEEAAFEKWLLTDIELCKDVAEFAAFAHALRGGAFRAAAAGAPQPRPPIAPPQPSVPAGATITPRVAEPAPPLDDAPPAAAPSRGAPIALLLGLGLVIVVLLVAVVALLVLG